jgi:hypothetical protein
MANVEIVSRTNEAVVSGMTALPAQDEQTMTVDHTAYRRLGIETASWNQPESVLEVQPQASSAPSQVWTTDLPP